MEAQLVSSLGVTVSWPGTLAVNTYSGEFGLGNHGFVDLQCTTFSLNSNYKLELLDSNDLLTCIFVKSAIPCNALLPHALDEHLHTVFSMHLYGVTFNVK